MAINKVSKIHLLSFKLIHNFILFKCIIKRLPLIRKVIVIFLTVVQNYLDWRYNNYIQFIFLFAYSLYTFYYKPTSLFILNKGKKSLLEHTLFTAFKIQFMSLTTNLTYITKQTICSYIKIFNLLNRHD